ncbi:MAG: hypothetical protein CVT64_11515 [Actinobacteria bacterium HGW-Actinobacteria-4]|nr:MAG: hypothetical protein CVT64_11515 [Actinobacteria bacterium HGW-Actinobacteria-4]
MKHCELSIEVAPIPPHVVARLKAAGLGVLEGRTSWRVITTFDVVGQDSVRAQAHAVSRSVIKEFELAVITDPPALSLRDPEAVLDERGTALMLEELRKAYDPDPLPRPKRKYYQRAMELGLGERKGD